MYNVCVLSGAIQHADLCPVPALSRLSLLSTGIILVYVVRILSCWPLPVK